MRISKTNPIKRLLRLVPRGVPLDVAALAHHGVDAKAASFYVRSGWLVRVGHGVYALPGDEVTALSAARLLQSHIAGLHIGGKSALSLQGVRHNLAVRESLVLWADARFALPKWFAERFPARAAFATLFDHAEPAFEHLSQSAITLTTPPGVLEGVRVSCPERAALEMLYDVGVHESFDEARSVFEGLRGLRPEVVGVLLSACTSIKAVRLFLKWSREMGVVDVEALHTRFNLRVGSQSRWLNRLPDGTLLILKPYG